jgi:hypothetical protein
MMLIEAVVGQLCTIDDRMVPARQLHTFDHNDRGIEVADAKMR